MSAYADAAMTPARTIPDTASLMATFLIDATARCGTHITSPDSHPVACGLYLAEHNGIWFHLRDRCESCVLHLDDGEACEWAHEHHAQPVCAAPSPLLCEACPTPLTPPLELDGHPDCLAPGRCCGCCEPTEPQDPDAARDAAHGL